MRVASLLIVLGSLLVLCSTATHAHRPTSTARVGLEKRNLDEEEWISMAVEAAELVRSSEEKHVVQPDRAQLLSLRQKVQPSLREGEDARNQMRAILIDRSPLPTDKLKERRNQAFGTMLRLLLQLHPGSPHATFLAQFRVAADAYDVLKRASELRGDWETPFFFDSTYVKLELARAVRTEVGSDTPSTLLPEQLEAMIRKVLRAWNVFQKAQTRIAATLEWYSQSSPHNQISFHLTDLDKQLKIAESELKFNAFKLIERLRQLEDMKSMDHHRSDRQRKRLLENIDQQTWEYRDALPSKRPGLLEQVASSRQAGTFEHGGSSSQAQYGDHETDSE